MKYRFGSHMSIAGGYYKSVEAAQAVGCDCVQLFTKNNNQWRAKEITLAEAEKFQSSLKELGITNPLSHASYLINLASPDDELWNKSIESLIVEWQRAQFLQLDGVVVHPGAFVSSTPEQGLERIAIAIKKAFLQVKPERSWLLLENTAGQGSCLGWNMEQLGQLIGETGADMMVGTCIDTCHAHVAGYDLSTSEGLLRLVREAKAYGVDTSIRAIHLNDSLRPAGSRIDRHEHIGLGTISPEGFSRFLKHPRFKKLPMYLETAKGETEEGIDWDIANLQTLREWVK